MFTKAQLKAQLKEMGILPTDTVVLHISLKSVGETEGGADGIIDAFCEYLSDGLFIVPTHTWLTVGPENPRFDVRVDKPCVGTLPTVAAFRKDGIRSLNPTHSMWVHGKNAAQYVAGEELGGTSLPHGGAWNRLSHVGAKILLIGVGHNRNTYFHSVDGDHDFPCFYVDEPFTMTIIDHDGNTIQCPWQSWHCINGIDTSARFGNYEKALLKWKAQTPGKFGNAEVKVVDAAKANEVIQLIFSRATEYPCFEHKPIPEEWYE